MTRSRSAYVVIASLGCLAFASGCVREQTNAAYAQESAPMTPAAGRESSAKPAEPGAKPAEGAVDPAVIAALNQMGAFLRSLQTFAIRSENTIDEILDTGQKIQFAELVEMWVRRPDGLRVNYASDHKQRQFFYDARTFTLYAPQRGFYASFAAPPVLSELIDVLEQRYNIEMPLVDLFYWGTEKSGLNQLVSAMDVGPGRVGQVECDHYALQQSDVDWQLWIERGPQRLPRKLLITSKREPAQPQFAAVLGWNLRPVLDDASFTFQPPRGAQRIAFEPAGATLRPTR